MGKWFWRSILWVAALCALFVGGFICYTFGHYHGIASANKRHARSSAETIYGQLLNASASDLKPTAILDKTILQSLRQEERKAGKVERFVIDEIWCSPIGLPLRVNLTVYRHGKPKRELLYQQSMGGFSDVWFDEKLINSFK